MLGAHAAGNGHAVPDTPLPLAPPAHLFSVLNIMMYWAIDYFLPRKIELNTKNVLRAGAILALFVSIAVGHDMQTWETNYFKILNVPRTASTREIRAAWKEMSKVMHPDVNDSPDAADVFVRLGKIKDCLTSETGRKVYDRWGEKMYEAQHHDVWLSDPAILARIHFQEYFGPILVTFIATMDTPRSRSRLWCLTMLAALFYYEIMLKYDDESDWDYLMPLLPQWTIHEKVKLLHTTAFFLITLMSGWAGRTYVDMDAFRFEALTQNQQALGTMLEELRAEVESVSGGKKSKPSDGLVPVVDGKELRRQAKINRFKAARGAGEGVQQQQQQGGGGVNWINLIILLLTLYYNRG